MQSESIGIDLGVKSFAVISDGRNYPNINKSNRTKDNGRRKLRVKRVNVPIWTNKGLKYSGLMAM